MKRASNSVNVQKKINLKNKKMNEMMSETEQT